MAPDETFYVGYAPSPPAAVRGFLRRVVAGLGVVALALPLVLLAAQAPFAPAAFEFGTERTYRGTLRVQPVPRLVLARPGDDHTAPAGATQLLLVAPGKHGASELLRGLDGSTAEVRGTLVYREGVTMLEVAGADAVVPAEGRAVAEPAAVDLGTHSLGGEIVDTKCHLGVMRPGDGKTHRQCAARCLSGGIPPALRVTGDDGTVAYYLLVGRDGAPIGRALLDRVAEPVRATGRVERRGALLFLYVDPADVERLAEARP